MASDADLLTLFDRLDKDKSQTLSVSELRRAFEKKGLPEKEVDKIFEHLDPNKTGKVARQEFVSKVNKLGTKEKALFNWFLIFERYDRDGSGFLSKGELMEAMKAAGMTQSSSEITKLLQKLDKDNDDKVSLKEFITWKAGIGF